MMHRRILQHATLLLGLLLFSACASAADRTRNWDLSVPAAVAAPSTARVPAQAPSALRGAQIYQQKCEACHGTTGAGDGPSAAGVRAQGKQVPSLIEPARVKGARPADWFDVVTDGRLQNLMPPFGGSLGDQERWDVLAYVWALAAPGDELARARNTYEAQCAQCHAAPAQLTPPVKLAGRSLADTAALLANQEHAALKLTDVQRTELAQFVRSIGYVHADTATLRNNNLQGDGEIVYLARNVNQKNAPVRDGEILLHAYDAQSEVLTRTARLNAQGEARFGGLPRSRGYFYEPELTLNGARFFAVPVQLTSTMPVTVELPVFDVAQDARAISIGEWHFFVQQAGDNTLTVVEVFIFENASDRAYISKPGQSLQLTVPEGAKNLRFDGPGIGARFVREGNVLIDRDAVLPGENATSVTMIYDLPYSGGKTVRREHAYPVKLWDVILPDGPLRAQGPADRGLQNTPAGSVRLYTGAPLVQQGAVTFELTGSVRGVPVPGNETTAVAIAAGMLALAIAGCVFVVLRSRALGRPAPINQG